MPTTAGATASAGGPPGLQGPASLGMRGIGSGGSDPLAVPSPWLTPSPNLGAALAQLGESPSLFNGTSPFLGTPRLHVPGGNPHPLASHHGLGANGGGRLPVPSTLAGWPGASRGQSAPLAAVNGREATDVQAAHDASVEAAWARHKERMMLQQHQQLQQRLGQQLPASFAPPAAAAAVDSDDEEDNGGAVVKEGQQQGQKRKRPAPVPGQPHERSPEEVLLNLRYSDSPGQPQPQQPQPPLHPSMRAPGMSPEECLLKLATTSSPNFGVASGVPYLLQPNRAGLVVDAVGKGGNGGAGLRPPVRLKGATLQKGLKTQNALMSLIRADQAKAAASKEEPVPAFAAGMDKATLARPGPGSNNSIPSLLFSEGAQVSQKPQQQPAASSSSPWVGSMAALLMRQQQAQQQQRARPSLAQQLKPSPQLPAGTTPPLEAAYGFNGAGAGVGVGMGLRRSHPPPPPQGNGHFFVSGQMSVGGANGQAPTYPMLPPSPALSTLPSASTGGVAPQAATGGDALLMQQHQQLQQLNQLQLQLQQQQHYLLQQMQQQQVSPSLGLSPSLAYATSMGPPLGTAGGGLGASSSAALASSASQKPQVAYSIDPVGKGALPLSHLHHHHQQQQQQQQQRGGAYAAAPAFAPAPKPAKVKQQPGTAATKVSPTPGKTAAGGGGSGGGKAAEGRKLDSRVRISVLEEEVKSAAAAGRKLRLMNETLKELVAAKARNDEEVEGKVVGELKAQNGGICALLERLRRLDQSDPAAVLAMTEQVLEVLNLPAPTLPPHVVEVAAPPGMMHVVEAVRG